MKISCCGTDCQACDAFVATMNDDDQMRARVAAAWSEIHHHPFRPEDINCTGCHSHGVQLGYCGVCQVRACCYERGRDNCAGCGDYPCEHLKVIFQLAPENQERLDSIGA